MNNEKPCGVVYKLTFPNNKNYFGQTIHFKNRMNSYRRGECKGQRKLYYAIKRYKWENVKTEIVKECQCIQQLNHWEKYFIYIHDTTNIKNGYNISSGGNNARHSEETKRIIGKKSKQKYIDNPELRRIVAQNRIGIPLSDNHRHSISKNNHLSKLPDYDNFNIVIGELEANGVKWVMEKYKVGNGTVCHHFKRFTGKTMTEYFNNALIKHNTNIKFSKETFDTVVVHDILSVGIIKSAKKYNVSPRTLRNYVERYTNYVPGSYKRTLKNVIVEYIHNNNLTKST